MLADDPGTRLALAGVSVFMRIKMAATVRIDMGIAQQRERHENEYLFVSQLIGGCMLRRENAK
jgi:hypothetical protein